MKGNIGGERMRGNREFSIEAANTLMENLYQQQQRFFFSEEALVKVTRRSVDALFKKVCQDVADLMEVDRVEIWLFNDQLTTLTAETYYDKRGDISSFKNVLYQEKVPAYFEAIANKRVLAIEDTRNNPIMDGLVESLTTEYHEMQSMLDASIVLSWGVGGVICCLSKGERKWTPIHKQVLASIADMLAFIIDRMHRKEVEEHVYELAYRDPLTGLRNGNAFYERVEEHLKMISKEKRGVFIYFTIDQYQDIRAVLGFEGAEQILIKVGNRLKRLFPESSTIARISFDHFAIFAPVLLGSSKLSFDIDDITKKLREPLDILGEEVYITFSYGVSYFPDHVSSVKEGVQASRIALEHAKEQKERGAQGVFQPYMYSFMKHNLASEMSLRRGLDLEEFRLFYQPKVLCETGEIIGFEALIRWQHPEKGLIFPNEFIKLAESIGLSTAIGEWVIKEAVKQLHNWKENGKTHLTVSINLSPTHFLSKGLPDYLLQCVQEAGIEPSQLILEITEDIALEDKQIVVDCIFAIKELGFPISIDDFGKGYSTFTYLQSYPVHQIKIDRQFIQHIDKNYSSEVITETIIQLAKKLGLQTVAEGVETIEEWACIKRMGCDEVQGYYFSRPQPIERIEEMLTTCIKTKKVYLPLKVERDQPKM